MSGHDGSLGWSCCHPWDIIHRCFLPLPPMTPRAVETSVPSSWGSLTYQNEKLIDSLQDEGRVDINNENEATLAGFAVYWSPFLGSCRDQGGRFHPRWSFPSLRLPSRANCSEGPCGRKEGDPGWTSWGFHANLIQPPGTRVSGK